GDRRRNGQATAQWATGRAACTTAGAGPAGRRRTGQRYRAIACGGGAAMKRTADLLLTALAHAVGGSTYYVTSEWLPDGHPMMLAMLRALPAGLLLLAIVRQLPKRERLVQLLVLGTLNFAVFWTLLFVAAQRLPGGVAATLGSAQALLVLLLARGI